MTFIYNYIIVICNINNLVLLSVCLPNNYSNIINHFLLLNNNINTFKEFLLISLYHLELTLNEKYYIFVLIL